MMKVFKWKINKEDLAKFRNGNSMGYVAAYFCKIRLLDQNKITFRRFPNLLEKYFIEDLPHHNVSIMARAVNNELKYN